MFEQESTLDCFVCKSFHASVPLFLHLSERSLGTSLTNHSTRSTDQQGPPKKAYGPKRLSSYFSRTEHTRNKKRKACYTDYRIILNSPGFINYSGRGRLRKFGSLCMAKLWSFAIVVYQIWPFKKSRKRNLLKNLSLTVEYPATYCISLNLNGSFCFNEVVHASFSVWRIGHSIHSFAPESLKEFRSEHWIAYT